MDQEDPGIGLRVRAARARLGWSRESLAFHSGLSWAGVSQVESGRRRELRSGTLAALAGALGVSVDYLVLGHPGAAMFDHRMVIYSSDAELLASAGQFLAGASDQGHAALAVLPKRNMSLLRKELGEAAESVRFVESARWHRSPTNALNAYEEFCSTQLADGAPWVRIVGELGWGRRSASDARAWVRFESLLNLVFAYRPVSMLCLCNASSLPPRIKRPLSSIHPKTVIGGEPLQAPPREDPRGFLLEP